MPAPQLSQSDIEFAWLGAAPQNRSEPTLKERRRAFHGGVNAFTYFSNLSGLTPAAKYSTHDHQVAYYRAQTGLTTGSLADLRRKFWAG